MRAKKSKNEILNNKLKESILKFSLQNALMHSGKADPKSVLGKVLAENNELRDKAKEVLEFCEEIVKDVNRLDLEKQREKLKELSPELLEEKKRKKELPELPNAEFGKVVTRIPPEPSKYNHIGHALSFLINYLYSKKYNGKCVLRFEDTNPKTSRQEYVDAMKEDVLEYLDIRPDRIVFVSDDMERFYELAEKLILREEAYVCFCQREKMQDLRKKGIECECRKKNAEQNLKEWKNMLNRKYKEGECSLRLKINMNASNYVMRDPVIFRIVYEPHYRQGEKYCVYPVYDFENAVEEEFCGVTHILRSSEFGKMRVELQDYIKDLFNFRKQTVVQYGRFNVAGAVTQGRIIRQMIEEKKVIGWDDPSLVTLRALRRRGIQRETYYELAKTVGLSPTQTNIEWSVISAINRKILDPIAKRFFFIENPVSISIKNAPKQDINIKLHPEHPEYGFRHFRTSDEFYIEKKDFEDLREGELCRLMECLNFRKRKDALVFDSSDVKVFKEEGKKIIHWLPKDEKQLVKARILTPEHNYINGIAESNVKNIKIGDVVQFERFGFCRLDEIIKEKNEDVFVFWFTHK
ncbi:MAG: glutamate--tRNA ligase [Candidatus Woesearchaeota archaeon]